MIGADSGQAAVLAVGAVAVCAASLVATALLGRTAHDAARARTAADAAALAAVAGRAADARALAAANGGVVVSYTQWSGPGGSEVVVTVRVGRATAAARATAGS